MVSILFALMVTREPQFPAFSAKFVEGDLNTDITIIEAKASLSVIGFSSYRMGDGPVPQPLTILSGHHYDNYDVDEPSAFWSYKIVDRHRVLGETSMRPEYKLNGKPAWYVAYPTKYAEARAKGDRVVPVKTIRAPSIVRGADTGIGVGERDGLADGWMFEQIRRRIGDNYSPHVEIETSDRTRPFVVSNFGYLGKDEFMVGGAPRHWFAGIDAGSGYRLLEDCVRGPIKYKIERVLWEAKTGWMIATASIEGNEGLVWLFPKHG